MRILVLVLVFLRFLCCYARDQRVSRRQRKIAPLKVVSPVFWAVQDGQAATLNCPLKSGVLRMYKYIRRVKNGKELEYASRKLAILLGLKYKWYKDGIAIRHHRTAWSMKFNKVQFEDSGVYTCKVFTSKGGATRNFTLKVFEKPKDGQPIVETRKRNVSLRTGAATVLECLCKNAKTRPQIHWLKWNAKNQEISNNINKSVLSGKPKKSYEIVNNTFYEEFEIKRKVGGGRKQTLFGFRLRLKNVKVGDSGIYTCFVRNKYGNAHRNFLVSVQSTLGIAPYPTRPKKLRPRFMAFPAASSAKLKCYITGDPPLKYEWYKNGEKLTFRRLDPKLNTSAWCLRLREVVPSDSGEYTCVASNPYGTLKHNFTFKVIEKIRSAPILAPNYPKNVSVSKGQNAALKCIEIVSGSLPDYRWYKWHSVPASYPILDVQNASQYTMINPVHYTTIREKTNKGIYQYGVKLTLQNITQNDVGLYVCVVSNHIGFEYSSAFVSLINEGAPKFLPTKRRPLTINIPVVHNVNMDCSATGNPKPNIKWYKNGKPLAVSSIEKDFVMSGYTLKLSKVQQQYSGNYTCNVSNVKGSISHTFNVKIQERLFSRPIILPQRKTAIRFGQRHELKCVVVSSEPLTVSWVRNIGEEKIENETKPKNIDKYIYASSYIIPNATNEHTGIYWCVAKNRFGVSNRKFQVQTEA